MALVLIKEDGTGKVDANSYADMADGDAYHEGHLYATAWTAATAANKEKALVFATRLIDSQFQFWGARANEAQGLQWPRENCRDPDARAWGAGLGGDLAADLVPKALVQATCEMAREVLVADRTAAPAGEGVATTHASTYTNNGTTSSSNSTTTTYSKSDTRPVISKLAQAMLLKYGALLSGGSGAVRLVRT